MRRCLLHTQYRATGGIILLLTQVFHQPRNPMESEASNVPRRSVCTHWIHQAKAWYHCLIKYALSGAKRMQSIPVSAEFLAWAEHEGIDLSMLYERLQLTPTERMQRHQMALELV